MDKKIPVYTSLRRASKAFMSDIKLPAVIARGTYGIGDLQPILFQMAGAMSIGHLNSILPFVVDDYEQAFNLKPLRASRIYGRPAGAHIDRRWNEPVLHIELTEGEQNRELIVATGGGRTLIANRDSPVRFEDARASLGLESETFSGELVFGDLTLMRRTLHEFRSEDSSVNTSALRLSQ